MSEEVMTVEVYYDDIVEYMTWSELIELFGDSRWDYE